MNKDLKYFLSLPYKTILEFEPEDKTWVAYCPELGRGTCYAIAETQSEALSQLLEVKETIIQYAIDEGHQVPEPNFEDEELPSGQFLVRIPKILHRDLKERADKEGISLNQFVLFTLSQTVGYKKAIDDVAKSMSTHWATMALNASRFILWDNENLGNVLSNWSITSIRDSFIGTKKDDLNIILANQLTGEINVKVAKVAESKKAYSKSRDLQEIPN
jgi:predicted HicB family RNase H-like nuclease